MVARVPVSVIGLFVVYGIATGATSLGIGRAWGINAQLIFTWPAFIVSYLLGRSVAR